MPPPRAFPPGHPLTPAAYREVGQPVIVPGDMGRYSFVLAGTQRAYDETFGSTCHGAGRRMSRGAAKKAARGLITGHQVVDFEAECYFGSYHDVDSSEMSFKMAGILAFRTVAPECKPVLLEPLLDVETETPEDCLGDVMGDLSARRGQILGTERDGRLTRVKAIVPEAEMYRYSTSLHSITHGRGTHRERPHGYAEAPPEVTAKVAAEWRKEKEEHEKG